MKLTLKMIFWISIFLLLFWLITAIVAELFPVEFVNDKDEEFFYSVRLLGLPIAILLTLTGTLRKMDTNGIIFTKVTLTICVSFFSIFIMFASAMSGMCAWTTTKILFENRFNPSVKIVERDFGCGAVDGTAPTTRPFKVREITSYLIYVTNIDTGRIDTEQWKRINIDKRNKRY